VSTLSGVAVGAPQIARIAQRAENDFVGVPCGPMDQTASAAARQGRVLLFDTRAGTIEHIPFEPAAHGLALLIVDTRVAHSLVDGEYAPPRGMRRPQTCSAYAGCATSGSTNCRPRCRRWTGRARPAIDPQAARAPAWTRVW
jgi:galactokinase